MEKKDRGGLEEISLPSLLPLSQGVCSVAAHSPPRPEPSIFPEGPGSSMTSVAVSGDRRGLKFIQHSYRKP